MEGGFAGTRPEAMRTNDTGVVLQTRATCSDMGGLGGEEAPTTNHTSGVQSAGLDDSGLRWRPRVHLGDQADGFATKDTQAEEQCEEGGAAGLWAL